MAEESHRSTAAEIPVTSNGDLDQSPEMVFQRVRACSDTSENSIVSKLYNCLSLLASQTKPLIGLQSPSVDTLHLFRMSVSFIDTSSIFILLEEN